MGSRTRPAPKPGPRNSTIGPRFTFAHGLCFFLGVALAALGALLLSPRGQGSFHTASATAVPRPAARAPWGDLEYTTIDLERPDESFSNEHVPVPPTTWFFGQMTDRQVLDLFSAADLTPEQTRLLSDRSRWTTATNGWLLRPPPDAVRTLSPTARHRLYSILRNFPENPCHRNPAHFPRATFDRWLNECGLPADKKQLFKSLTYLEGENVLFADFELIEAQCTLAERKRLAKAVSQSPSLYMRLRIGPNTDVDALLRYWGRGGRGKAMKPFIDAVARAPGGASIGVSFFFPAFARLRLYTYPDPQSDRAALREDCFWTAMNFLNDRPDNRFFDAGFVQKTLATDYREVRTNWAFGDLILLADDAGLPVHMCVYIADDVVFTKNGLDPIEPWRLLKIRDMLSYYSSDKAARLLAFRRNDFPDD